MFIDPQYNLAEVTSGGNYSFSHRLHAISEAVYPQQSPKRQFYNRMIRENSRFSSNIAYEVSVDIWIA